MSGTTKAPAELPQGISEAKLKSLKAQHGKVYAVNIPYAGKVVRGLFKKPTLAILSASASISATDPVGAGAMVYESCKLAVDPEMDDVDEVKLAAIMAVQGLFEKLTAEVGEA